MKVLFLIFHGFDPNNGISKNIILSSSYAITSDDLNSISLIDINSGTLELSSNNIIFTPKILNIKFNTNFTNILNINNYIKLGALVALQVLIIPVILVYI